MQARRTMTWAVGVALVITGCAPIGTGSHPAAAPVDRIVRGTATSTEAAVASPAVARAAVAATGVVPPTQDPVLEEVPLEVVDAAAGAVDGGAPTADPSPEAVGTVATSDGTVVLDVAAADGRTVSPVVESEGFQTLGVTWPEGEDGSALDLQVRTRSADGTWTGWQPLTVSDEAPDPGTEEASTDLRSGTDSLWVGEADALQVSVDATAGTTEDLALALVSSDEPATGSSATTTGAVSTGDAVIRAADYVTGAAGAEAQIVTASTAAPTVITRAQWGAAPQICTPDVASRLVGAVVHHTAGSNGYTTVAQAMQQIRNDQSYHQTGRGWCDLGYNFVVDKWGNIYEGRANSLTQPVIGVHAGGFNTGTVGVAMLGTYDAAPSAATQNAVGLIIGWRLGVYGVDPQGSMSYATGAGENSRFLNQTVTLPRVFGHRDVSYTACPGAGGYAALGAIRARAKQVVISGWINPSLTASTISIGSSVGVRSQVMASVSWSLTVVDTRTGIQMVRTTGTAGVSTGATVATWDARSSAGNAVGPGTYRLTLAGTDVASGVAVAPFQATVTVTGSQSPPTVAAVALSGDLTFVPITPVRVLDTRPTGASLGPASRVDVQVAGTAGIPAGAKAVALNVTTVHSSGVTHLRAWPAGGAVPSASVLNTDGGRTSAASVVVGVGGEGKVSLYNDAGSTHLLADVTGYYVTGTSGARFEALATAGRVLDTRVSGGALAPQTRRTIQVAGVAGVPADATAVVANVVSVRTAGVGYVSLVPAGAAVGATSTVNNQPGRDVANRTVVALSAGRLDVYVDGVAQDVVVDVVGWYGPSGTSVFTPIAPVRAFDTRPSGSPLAAGETRLFDVSSLPGVPSGVSALAVNLTSSRPTSAATYLTLWGAGARPATSDLNTGGSRDQANLAVVEPSAGHVSVYNNLGATHVVGDVFGYFR